MARYASDFFDLKHALGGHSPPLRNRARVKIELSGEGRSPPAFAIQPFGQVFHAAHHTAEKNSRNMKIAVDLILIPAEIYIMHNGRWMMSNIQITSRLSGAVIFETEIAAEYEGYTFGFRLGLAVKAAYNSGADLSDADLSDADLSDAKIIRVIARATRLDGYEFIAFDTDKGIIIRAGCRTMSPDDYRAHVARGYHGTDKAEETLAILDYIEARAAKLCWADVSA